MSTLSTVATYVLLLSPTCAIGQSTAIASSHHNQTAETNNGVMIQNNIVVAPAVKRTLRRRAKEDDGDERGWLRVLTPGNEPSVAWAEECLSHYPGIVGPSPLMAVLGGGAASLCDASVCGLIRDKHQESENAYLASAERKGKSILLSLIILDETGKVVATLDKNRPHINKNNAFDWSRPDEHTLTVTDQRNRRVLLVRFLNHSMIYVEGIFYDSQGDSAKVTAEDMRLDGSGFSDVHVGHTCVLHAKSVVDF